MTVKDRLVQAIYVFFCILSCIVPLLILINCEFEIFYGYTRRYESVIELITEAVFVIFICILSSITLYLLGWTIRWVTNGTKTTIFNYFLKK